VVAEVTSLDQIHKVLTDLASKVGEIHHQWPDLTGLVLEHERRIQEHERRIMTLESGRLRTPSGPIPRPMRSVPPPTSAKAVAREYGLPETSTGSFKVAPDFLTQVADRFQKLEQEREVLDAYWSRQRTRAAWALPFVVAFTSFIAWVLVHFFKL
jgi:hypothetical protein